MSDEKTRTTIYIDKKQFRELKIKALDAGISLSELLTTAGTITPLQTIKNHKDNLGAANPNEQ